MAINHSTPQEAHQISEHTIRAIDGLRRCTTSSDLKSQVASWFVWAKTNGVCQAIRDHIRQVEQEMAARVRKDTAAPREVRKPGGNDA